MEIFFQKKMFIILERLILGNETCKILSHKYGALVFFRDNKYMVILFPNEKKY